MARSRRYLETVMYWCRNSDCPVTPLPPHPHRETLPLPSAVTVKIASPGVVPAVQVIDCSSPGAVKLLFAVVPSQPTSQAECYRWRNRGPFTVWLPVLS